jgi:opacity protein-like surface antigen
MIRIAGMIVIMALVCVAPARAQSWELSAFTGFTLPVELENATRGVDSTSVDGGFTWQVQSGKMLTSRWGVEAIFSQQFSSYDLEVDGVSATLFNMTVMQVHGNVVYDFGRSGSRIHPFAFGGMGSAFFQAKDIPTESKFSIGLGGGVKMFPWNGIGLRVHARYLPTFLNDEGAREFCDPFGFCQSMLRQLEVAGGITFRF